MVIRVRRKPFIRFGLLELGFQRRTARRANINGTTRVMFTVTRGCAHTQDLINRRTALKLPPNNRGLSVERAKCRGNTQDNTILTRRLDHSGPGGCCRWNEQMLSPFGIGLGGNQLRWLTTDLKPTLS